MTTVHPFSHAPVLFLIGYGYRPAHQPADYIGPRMDCPMWLPAPDADLAYLSKYDAPADALGHGFGFVLWPDTAPAAPQITAASLAGPIPGPAPFTAGPLIPGPWHPPVDYPCNCITHPPSNPQMPEPSPVPLPASAGLLLVAVAALALWRRK